MTAGKKGYILSDRLFAILLVMALVTTFMTGSVMQNLYVEYFFTKQAKLAMANNPDLAAEIRRSSVYAYAHAQSILVLDTPMTATSLPQRPCT